MCNLATRLLYALEVCSKHIIVVYDTDQLLLESEYQDRLELKSTIDRTLGVGVSQTDNTLLVLTASTLMKVHLNMERILAFNPE